MLKRLELQGFKSFPSRVAFDFDRGITVLVGPNGSGKSNVADAVRWVLGEQSPRAVRGKKSEDVIFVGSSSRHPLGMAEVALVLQDEGERLGIDYHEVRVARRLYRSGESDYLLNGARVRLRDVTSTLLRAGLHADGYNVISQGAVEELVLQRPEERRAILEHAADISRHQARLAEARAKLATAEQNLTRAQDVVAELEPHARRLRGQAERAERFSARRQELAGLGTLWYRHSLRRQAAGAAAAGHGRFAAAGRVADFEARIAERESAQREFRAALGGLERALEEARSHAGRAHRAREAVLADLAAGRQRAGFLEARVAALQGETERERRRADEIEAELAIQPGPDDGASEATARLSQEAAEVARRAEAAVRERREKVEAVRRSIELAGRERAGLERRLAELRARQEAALRHAAERGVRRGALEARAGGLAEAAGALETKLVPAEAAAHAAGERQRARADEVRRAREALRAMREAADQRRAELTLARSAVETAARELSQASGADGRCRLLGASAVLPAGLEAAVAAALGEWAEAVVCGDPDQLDALFDPVGGRRRGVLPPTPRVAAADAWEALPAVAGDEGAEPLLTRLGELPADHPLRGLLRWTLLAPDRSVARRVWEALRVDERPWQVVSRDGWAFAWHGGVARGVDDRAARLLALRRRNAEAADALAAAERAHEGARVALAAAEAAGATAEAAEREAGEAASAAQVELRLLRRQLEEARQERARVRQELQALPSLPADPGQTASAEAVAAADQLRHLDENLERLRREETDADRASRGAQDVWQTAVAEREARRAEHTRAESEQRARAELVERQRREAGRARVEAARADEERGRLAEESEAQAARLQGLAEEEASLGTELATCDAELARLGGERQAVERSLEPIEAELRGLRVELARAMEARQETTLLERQTADELLRLREEADAFAREWGLDGRRQEVQLRLPRADRAVRAGQAPPCPAGGASPAPTECPVDSGFPGLPDSDADEPVAWSHLLLAEELDDTEAEIDLAGSRRRMLSLQRELRALGRVGEDVLDEYREVEGRLQFIRAQQTDLHHTIRELEGVIGELETLMRDGFSAAFERVNAAFGEMFERLFGGGTARLVLIEPGDPLRTGVEIVAQPPGKRLQAIVSLSGGERSLTSVALIFALLRINPLPFCVLDEVDAALDEPNARRFAALLQEYAERTQFVVITHNRATMEIARALYGITMGGDGVTTVLSLRPHQAHPQATNGSTSHGVQSSVPLQQGG